MRPLSAIRSWLTVFLASLICWPAAALSSVDPDTRHWLISTWETEDGLPENSATAMVQTMDGYLWFGTFAGLVRFDGVSFTVFNRSNTRDLPSDGIVNLHLDRKGRLWVSTLGGIVFRDGQDWRSVQQLQLTNDFIRTFTERANGDLLLTTFHGKILEFADNHFTELPAPPGHTGDGYLGGIDEEGHWHVAHHKFVGRWNGNRWEPIIADSDLKNAVPSKIGLAPAHDGSFWLLLNSELRKYSHGIEVARRPLHEYPGNFWSMTEDSTGTIWICTSDQGICQILPDDRMVKWNEQKGISYHGVRFVFEDRERNLWVGTSGGGLQRFKLRRFQVFGPENGLSERVVKSACPAPSGGLWIGTYGDGLFHWTETGITNVPLAGWTNRHLYVQSVLTDRKGRTWVGTFGSGLFMFDDHECRHFPAEQSGGDNVIALFEDSRGWIWISGGHGVSAFAAGVFHVYGPEQDLPDSGVCCFAEDSHHDLWLSNQQGLFRLENDRFMEVRDSEGKPLRQISCLTVTDEQSIWMGTIGEGLLRWRDGTVSTIGAQAGLAVPSVHAIMEDNQGYFWMPSNRGIMRVKRSELESVANGTTDKLVCQLLDLNDGLASSECPAAQQPTCTRDQKGRLWFPTIKGVAMTDPAAFRPNTVPPLASIGSIVYFGSTRDAARNERASHRVEAPFSGPIELPAGCHGIEIHYAAPSFVSPTKVRFQINLDGRELEWREVGDRRMVYFDELSPGPHLFGVRAANDDGIWDQTGASLALTVLPFFWQTAWFRAILVVVTCGVAALWIYRFKIRLDAKHSTQRAFTRQLILSQENERKRIAAELHDGLGQDLLLIKNRLGLLAANESCVTPSQLQEISTTTSRAIAEVRAISHALRPSALEQVGLTKAIEWMVEQIAETSSAKFSTELDDIDRLLAPEMEINLYRIVQEALNNVIKHAQASQVILEARHEPKTITVSVFDDGRGFDVEELRRNGERRSGLGLTSMEERSKVLGGQIEIRSELGVGTRLILCVPLPKGGK